MKSCVGILQRQRQSPKSIRGRGENDSETGLNDRGVQLHDPRRSYQHSRRRMFQSRTASYRGQNVHHPRLHPRQLGRLHILLPRGLGEKSQIQPKPQSRPRSQTYPPLRPAARWTILSARPDERARQAESKIRRPCAGAHVRDTFRCGKDAQIASRF